jgi:hypothetical protein
MGVVMRREELNELAVLITCPTVAKPVKTGLFMNKPSFQRAVIAGRKAQCPHCGRIHLWSKDEAHLAGERPLRVSAP